MLIPEDWSNSLVEDLNFAVSELDRTFLNPAAKLSDSRTFTGPEDKGLNILITPLLPGEPEPGLAETGKTFAGLAEKFSLNVIKTGAIRILDQEHFYATYYLGRLFRGDPIHYFKKYVIYRDRVEYLLTARLYELIPGRPLPTDERLLASEKAFDEMVASIELIPLRDPVVIRPLPKRGQVRRRQVRAGK
jgi:hypothetical protein